MSIDDLLDRSAPPVPISDAARDELHRLTGIRPPRQRRPRGLPLALIVAATGGLLATGAAATVGVATAAGPAPAPAAGPGASIAAGASVVREWHDEILVADVVHRCLLRLRLVNEAGAGVNPAFAAADRVLRSVDPAALPADPGQGPLLGSAHSGQQRAGDVMSHRGGAVVLAVDQHLAAQHLDASAVHLGYEVSCD